MSVRVSAPNLRPVRRALLAAYDRLTVANPDAAAWHPTHKAACAAQAHVKAALKILQDYLGDERGTH